MLENTAELAENKLLLLYILHTVKNPISNSQLTELILEDNLLNYFTLQQYLSELEESGFIKYVDINDKKLLKITNNGVSVLSFFINRISEQKKELLKQRINEKYDLFKKELTIQSDYTPISDDNFLIDLKAFEGKDILIELKLSVPTKKQAAHLCANWQENSAKTYNSIINLLLNEDSKQ